MDSCPRRLNEFGPWDHTEGQDVPIRDRCPFCGSLTGDAFMVRVRAGERLGPTDKSYKVYLDDAKFYFQHLSEDQRREFFELYRDGKLNVGYPGRFYVLPFFIRAAENPQESPENTQK